MEQLISVRSLFKETDAYAGKQIKVGGWVRNLRASKTSASSTCPTARFSRRCRSSTARACEFQRDLQAEHRRGRHRHRYARPDAGREAAVRAAGQRGLCRRPVHAGLSHPAQAPFDGVSAHRDASASAHEHVPGRVPRPQPHRLRHPQVLPGTRFRLCPHPAHHRLRLRGRRRNVPGHNARS